MEDWNNKIETNASSHRYSSYSHFNFLIISYGDKLINDNSYSPQRFNKSFTVNFNTLRIGGVNLCFYATLCGIVSRVAELFIDVIYCTLRWMKTYAVTRAPLYLYKREVLINQFTLLAGAMRTLTRNYTLSTFANHLYIPFSSFIRTPFFWIRKLNLPFANISFLSKFELSWPNIKCVLETNTSGNG